MGMDGQSADDLRKEVTESLMLLMITGLTLGGYVGVVLFLIRVAG